MSFPKEKPDSCVRSSFAETFAERSHPNSFRAISLSLSHKTTSTCVCSIVTAFTIEPGHPVLHPFAPNAKIRRPIEGIMTTYGYVVPTGHNSMDIWFVGGTLEVVRPGDIRDWRHIFNGNAAGKTTRHRRRHQQQPGGHPNNKGDTDMDALDGRIHYSLERPVNAGAHIDILYLDETLRIVRSNQGILSVFARVPYFPDE